MTRPNYPALGHLRRRALMRRLDALAAEQLCAELARLENENATLREQLEWTERCAESWRDDALRLMGIEHEDHIVTLRMDGNLQPEARA